MDGDQSVKVSAARAAWPEFAAFVADYRRVFGECKARQLARDPGLQGVAVTHPLPAAKKVRV